jgi:hypothetical protein
VQVSITHTTLPWRWKQHNDPNGDHHPSSTDRFLP